MNLRNESVVLFSRSRCARPATGAVGPLRRAAPRDDCFEGLEIQGDAICFTQVEGGYCSHTCTSNADCCAVEGECDPAFDYVCTGLEERSGSFCFVACNLEGFSGGDQSICDAVAEGLECRNTGRGVGSQVCLPPASGG